MKTDNHHSSDGSMVKLLNQCFLFPFVMKTIQDGPLMLTVRTRTDEHLHVCSGTLIANTVGGNDVRLNMLCGLKGTKQKHTRVHSPLKVRRETQDQRHPG